MTDQQLILSNLKIHEATAENPEMLEVLIEHFLTIFPEDERYVPYIRETAQQAVTQNNPHMVIHQWVFEYEEQYIGFRMFNFLKQRNFTFSRYLGLLRQHRYKGIGHVLHNLMLAQTRRDSEEYGYDGPVGICAEVEGPEHAHDPKERERGERRVKVLEAFGAQWLPVDYVEPVMVSGVEIKPDTLANIKPRQMRFLFYEMSPPENWSRQELTTYLVKSLLLDNYRLPEDSWFVRNVLQSIRQ